MSTGSFTPPYMIVGLYDRDRREAIERPNRETVAAIFKRRDQGISMTDGALENCMCWCAGSKDCVWGTET